MFDQLLAGVGCYVALSRLEMSKSIMVLDSAICNNLKTCGINNYGLWMFYRALFLPIIVLQYFRWMEGYEMSWAIHSNPKILKHPKTLKTLASRNERKK